MKLVAEQITLYVVELPDGTFLPIKGIPNNKIILGMEIDGEIVEKEKQTVFYDIGGVSKDFTADKTFLAGEKK